jgi:hypothetical protein
MGDLKKESKINEYLEFYENLHNTSPAELNYSPERLKEPNPQKVSDSELVSTTLFINLFRWTNSESCSDDRLVNSSRRKTLFQRSSSSRCKLKTSGTKQSAFGP